MFDIYIYIYIIMAKYLDYSGVQTLWDKIKSTSKNKIDNIVSKSSFLSSVSECTPSETAVILSYNSKKYDSNGNVISSNPDVQELVINKASSSLAGVMSASDKTKLDSISTADINNLKALSTKINEGYSVVLTSNKQTEVSGPAEMA